MVKSQLRKQQQMIIKRLLKSSFYLLLILTLLISLLWYFCPKPPLLQPYSFSTAIYDSQHHLLRLSLSKDDKYRLYTPLDQISPQFIEATLLKEDRFFYSHHGVNPVALFKAFWATFISHHQRRGASTITMQLARMRFNINSKSIRGKLIQLLRALQLERHYSKSQLLEAYLNLASYGRNIEGIGAASLIYLQKPAQDLNLIDSVTLATIPQNPNKNAPFKFHHRFLKKARQELFLDWLESHPQDANQQLALDLPLQLTGINDLPFYAPHFVTDILQKNHQQQKIITTLNLDMQKLFEHIVKQYIEAHHQIGINNVAVILVDAETMGVKVLIGSGDFYNEKIYGQVNGVSAQRSSGSTLKPFIYALAMEQGLIHPQTILHDAPRTYGTYNPENYDYDFAGPIDATTALNSSRNIPAVSLLQQLSTPDLYAFLKFAEINNLKEKSHYGLALALGGAEISLEELVKLYAIFVNQGELKPIRKINSTPISTTNILFSPEVSFLILDMMKNNGLPNHIIYRNQQTKTLPIAWKTGTSHGFRDAWAVGVFHQYVLGVWIGNFNGQGNNSFSGRSAAGPLFAELFHALHYHFPSQPLTQKKKLNLTKVDICSASGQLPTSVCPHTLPTWFIPGISPIQKDTVFKEIAINQKTGLRACHYDQNTIFKVYEFWPSDILNLFHTAGIHKALPPAYEKNCHLNQYQDNSNPPEITSPYRHAIYAITLKEKSEIPFTATVGADVKTLYWFVNKTFIGKTSRETPLFWPAQAGKYIIRVIDDHGRVASRTITIKLI